MVRSFFNLIGEFWKFLQRKDKIKSSILEERELVKVLMCTCLCFLLW